jgi:urease accessory protein
MTASGAAGRLRLRATSRGDRTVLADAYRTAPFHPGPLHYRDGRAELILQDVSPGIFPEDRLEVDIAVDDGATLSVSNQGATKIYPSPSAAHAETQVSLSVAGGGVLWWLPGALIPFRDARYLARTTVRVTNGSRFALIEVITPGRLAMGECDLYSRLDLRLRIESAGTPVLIERTLLDPAERPLTMAGSRGRFACFGSLIMIGYPVPSRAECTDQNVWLGADGGYDLAIVRGVSLAAAPLQSALRALLHQADAQRKRDSSASGSAGR